MLYYFALLSIFTSSLLAIYNWKVQKGALFIAGILIILSTYALTHYYTGPTQGDFPLALLYGTLSPLWLLPGPLLFFYFRSIFQPGKIVVSWKDLLHFVPSLFHLINILPYIFSPFDYKLQVAHAIHENINNIQTININAFYSFKTAFLSRPISLLIYLLWCTIFFLKQLKKVSSRVAMWLLFFIISLLITTSAYLSIAFNLFSSSFKVENISANPVYLASGIAYILIPIALILFFPEVLYGIKKQDVDISAEKSDVSPDELAAHADVAKKIEQYLRREKPFLNPDFELAEIASALKVNPKQVSFACKHVLDIKFTDLRAQLRVEHAKELLKKGLTGTITIDAIGVDSGFKSRSTYYDAFKAETGMTPSQYLESIQTKKA
jgi:AraC-like DNA-binding protein